MFTDQDCGSVSQSAVDLNQKRFMLYCVLLYVVAAVLERTMARATIAYLEQRYTALESEIADALRQSPTDYRGRDPTQSSLRRAFQPRLAVALSQLNGPTARECLGF